MAGEEEGGEEGEMRSLALTPTWSVAAVLTLLVASSLIIERSIHRLSNWLKKTHRNPLFKAMEKMKEEMMLLGFVSLLLAATSRIISSICIDSKYYNSDFSPCTKEEVEESLKAENELDTKRDHILSAFLHRSIRRNLKVQYHLIQTCPKGSESFVSHEGLEQLHRFIFVMAVTHVTYSCLTMLLAILKVHTWRTWEDEAFRDNHESFSQIAYDSATRRQPPVLGTNYSFRYWNQNSAVMWLVCFFTQFGQSVIRADYLILRKGFIMNHNLAPTYDFHTYMIRSMEDEFEKIVGVSGVLWGFVVAFMLFNIDGSNLYFWIAILPVFLVLLVGAKLQHVIATLTSEGSRMSKYGPTIKPRDDLFWFKKPTFLLWLIHFVLFQNAFELASFFWFWWQFGYDSCFIKNHLLVYFRLILGFGGQFLCSYSTLPVYALVTQMGSMYKAALIPNKIRETMHGWGKDARRRRKRRGGDDSTVHTETSTVHSLDYEDEDDGDHYHRTSVDGEPPRPYQKIELQPTRSGAPRPGKPFYHLPVSVPGGSFAHQGSSHHGLLQRQSTSSAPSSPPPPIRVHGMTRSLSMPRIASPRMGTAAALAHRSDAHA